jgi:hypothetical protein
LRIDQKDSYHFADDTKRKTASKSLVDQINKNNIIIERGRTL